MTLRVESHEVCDELGWRTRLTTRETAILHALMSEPGRPLARHDLLDQVWGERYDGDGNALDVYVRRIRTKLTSATGPRSYVHTRRGQGYVFDARLGLRSAVQVGQAPHVLLIDDANDPADFHALREAGYRAVSEAASRAIIAVRCLQPLVLLIDVEMANGSGIDVCRRLREDPRTAGILIIAYATAPYLRAHRAALPANDYLARPIDPDELVLRVERLIGQPSLETLGSAPSP